MGASSYNPADMTQARQSIGAEAGKFGSVGDSVPTSVDSAMFGTLGNSAAVAQAATALCSSLHSEYAKAETLVGAIERALDGNLSNSSGTEQNNKNAFTAQQA